MVCISSSLQKTSQMYDLQAHYATGQLGFQNREAHSAAKASRLFTAARNQTLLTHQPKETAGLGPSTCQLPGKDGAKPLLLRGNI